MNIKLMAFLILVISIFIVSYLFTTKFLRKIYIQKKLFLDSDKGVYSKEKKSISIINYLSTVIKKKLVELAPNKIREDLEMILLLSGSKFSVGDLILAKVILLLLSVLLNMLLFQNNYKSLNNVAFSIILSLVLFIIPDFNLKRKGRLRQKKIKKTLPAFIDYLTIAVEAGLGLDTAIYRVIKHIHGPLAEEIAYAMTEMQFGNTKKEAFKNLSNKVKVPELTVFLNALVNGESLGISISSILRVQAQQLREKRKQEIQEAAYKLSIKLLFPLIFFILPSLFIILLGPAAIKIYTIFIK